ncbi:hypothetical protein RJ639_029071 [Escallonia herrerae]|uniref:Uncharacterized protein n=1 Tax=Escallonia herrerae TaxID=1293975 RepID=A0AA88X7H9_9ASTE|nr:hypothetical protein RJ639_029071 [Escallonia herrerae]
MAWEDLCLPKQEGACYLEQSPTDEALTGPWTTERRTLDQVAFQLTLHGLSETLQMIGEMKRFYNNLSYLAAAHTIPWAKANLNYTAQALIISGASIAAYFVTADKTILEAARRNARYDKQVGKPFINFLKKYTLSLASRLWALAMNFNMSNAFNEIDKRGKTRENLFSKT